MTQEVAAAFIAWTATPLHTPDLFGSQKKARHLSASSLPLQMLQCLTALSQRFRCGFTGFALLYLKCLYCTAPLEP